MIRSRVAASLRSRSRRLNAARSSARYSFPTVCLVSLLTVSLSCDPRTPNEPETTASTRTCLYSAHRIDQLDAFSDALGRPITCAMVFNNAAPGWDDLTDPWFLTHRDPQLNWASWKRADPDRRLIISQALVPDAVPPDWRERGAAGEYDGYARSLATKLVASGLGDSIIRLSHESNGLWTKDGLGADPGAYTAWRETWRSFAAAMRSVPGAAFEFDWTVNPGVQPIAFDDYYPGDDVVDIIGVDIYDFWEESRFGPAPVDSDTRWDIRYAEPAGVGELIAFAESHGKPLSIPEWSLSAPGTQGGIGDNPSFIDEIIRLLRTHDVSYQAYFAKSPGALVVDAPRSFSVYRKAFGKQEVPRHGHHDN